MALVSTGISLGCGQGSGRRTNANKVDVILQDRTERHLACLACQIHDRQPCAHRNDHLVPVEPVPLDLLLVALVQRFDSLEIVGRVEPLDTATQFTVSQTGLPCIARSGGTHPDAEDAQRLFALSPRLEGAAIENLADPDQAGERVSDPRAYGEWFGALLTTSRTSRAESGRSPRSTKEAPLDREGLDASCSIGQQQATSCLRRMRPHGKSDPGART